MKIAFVSVRYGAGILGGAEQACRQLAEHLAADGVDTEVHTTCATDAVTWADDLPAGATTEAGVRVHRYPSVSGRDPRFETVSRRVLADPVHQSVAAQREWLRLQGPVCPGAVDGAVESGADLVVTTPYLYWPAVEVASRTRRTVLQPAAHDEPPIHLPLFGETFAAAAGLAFYTDAERRLVSRLWPRLAAAPQVVVGLGVNPDAATGADAGRFRSQVGIGEQPYLLCLGRVDDGKGTRLLARFFAAYKRRRPGPLALVFSGPVVHPPDPHPDVVVTGPLTEDLKWAALAGATALVNPSAHESFSIVLLEAWAAGTPVVVNARCGATVEHVRRSSGGVSFAGYAGFEVAVDHLLRHPVTAAALGRAGRSYVESSFAWPVVTARYRRWLESVAHRWADQPVR